MKRQNVQTPSLDKLWLCAVCMVRQQRTSNVPVTGEFLLNFCPGMIGGVAREGRE